MSQQKEGLERQKVKMDIRTERNAVEKRGFSNEPKVSAAPKGKINANHAPLAAESQEPP